MRKDKKYQGLTQAEVIASREQYGTNVLTPPKKASLLTRFLEKFEDPLIIILLIAGFLSIGISCYEYYGLHEGSQAFFEPVGIFVAIFLATGLSFYFEAKANKEFTLLNKVNDDEPVRVIRDGNATEVRKRDVVVGDLVIIDTGQEIPADGVLLEAVSLNVDESSLTGEPTCHKSIVEADFDRDATYPTNHVERGTNVLEGHGIFRVTAVGDQTENGKVYTATHHQCQLYHCRSRHRGQAGLLFRRGPIVVDLCPARGRILLARHLPLQANEFQGLRCRHRRFLPAAHWAGDSRLCPLPPRPGFFRTIGLFAPDHHDRRDAHRGGCA